MRITVTARHADVDESLRAHAVELVTKVAKIARRPHHAQVVLLEDHGEAGVEIELHVPRGKVLVAKSIAPDHRSALDIAIDKLKRQLLDEKTSPRRRRPAGRAPRSKVPGEQ